MMFSSLLWDASELMIFWLRVPRALMTDRTDFLQDLHEIWAIEIIIVFTFPQMVSTFLRWLASQSSPRLSWYLCEKDNNKRRPSSLRGTPDISECTPGWLSPCCLVSAGGSWLSPCWRQWRERKTGRDILSHCWPAPSSPSGSPGPWGPGRWSPCWLASPGTWAAPPATSHWWPGTWWCLPVVWEQLSIFSRLLDLYFGNKIKSSKQ